MLVQRFIVIDKSGAVGTSHQGPTEIQAVARANSIQTLKTKAHPAYDLTLNADSYPPLWLQATSFSKHAHRMVRCATLPDSDSAYRPT